MKTLDSVMYRGSISLYVILLPDPREWVGLYTNPEIIMVSTKIFYLVFIKDEYSSAPCEEFICWN